ncbi:MAG: alpha-glucosidase/alpha-galactosidase, partial [Nocardioides sp.]
GEPVTIHANVANRGLIAELQSDLGVEVPTVIDGSGAHPRVMSGLLPPVGAALNRNFLNVVDLVTQAAVNEDRRMVHQAVMVDPNAAASLSLPTQDELVPAMIAAHGPLMPAWLR